MLMRYINITATDETKWSRSKVPVIQDRLTQRYPDFYLHNHVHVSCLQVHFTCCHRQKLQESRNISNYTQETTARSRDIKDRQQVEDRFFCSQAGEGIDLGKAADLSSGVIPPLLPSLPPAPSLLLPQSHGPSPTHTLQPVPGLATVGCGCLIERSIHVSAHPVRTLFKPFSVCPGHTLPTVPRCMLKFSEVREEFIHWITVRVRWVSDAF